MSQKALFLDRDGLLIVDKHYLSKPEEVELTLGVTEFLQAARDQGYLLFLFSNQSGVGRGYFTLEDVVVCNDKMLELMGLGDDLFTEICLATEAPSDPIVYRKPSPRFINEMVEKYGLDKAQCYMVGDKQSDLEAGINAGIQAVWIETGKATDKTEELKAYVVDHNVLNYKDLVQYREVALDLHCL